MRVSRNSDENIKWSDVSWVVEIFVGAWVFGSCLSAIKGYPWSIKLPIFAGVFALYLDIWLLICNWKFIANGESKLSRLLLDGTKVGLVVGFFLGGLSVVGNLWPGWTGVGIGVAVALFIVWAIISNKRDSRANAQVADCESDAE